MYFQDDSLQLIDFEYHQNEENYLSSTGKEFSLWDRILQDLLLLRNQDRFHILHWKFAFTFLNSKSCDLEKTKQCGLLFVIGAFHLLTFT